MALVVTQEGAQRLLQWLLGVQPEVVPTLHLLGMPYTPVPSSTLTVFAANEVGPGLGYSPVSLGPAKAVWTISGLPLGGSALSQVESWTFTGNVTVYGYYVSDDTQGVSLWAEALATSYPYPSGGVFALQLPLNLTTQTTSPYAMLPSGLVLPIGGTIIPAGFVACDGTAYLQSAQPNLFAAIGNTWNTFRGQAAPPAGQFRVPLLNGLALVGSGAAVAAGGGVGATSTRTVGAGLGEEQHTLTAAELPNQVVNVTSPQLAWNADQITDAVAAGSDFRVPDGGDFSTILAGGATGGGGGAHNNLQPSAGVQYMISL